MSDKEQFVFKDKDVPPTDDLILRNLGASGRLWQSVMHHIDESYSDMKGTWNWYNDGKQWLFKVVRKKKTIFWASVLEGAFKITFYFGASAEQLIVESDLPESGKKQYLTGPRYGKIRAITMEIGSTEDVETVRKLIDIRLRVG